MRINAFRRATVAPWLGAAIVMSGLLASSGARAHVTLESSTAAAGSYHKLVLRVPHGCSGSPTTGLAVRLPDGVTGAKPQPKPGWSVVLRREALAEPVRDGHGNVATDRVGEVIWQGGRLEDAHFDEFLIHVRLPNRPGETLRFPVVQTCETGEHRWVEVPDPGQRPGALRQPAPALLLVPHS